MKNQNPILGVALKRGSVQDSTSQTSRSLAFWMIPLSASVSMLLACLLGSISYFSLSSSYPSLSLFWALSLPHSHSINSIISLCLTLTASPFLLSLLPFSFSSSSVNVPVSMGSNWNTSKIVFDNSVYKKGIVFHSVLAAINERNSVYK